ncbi:MAG: hypothetical protein MUE99_00115 [Chitinophagaceae bacterium]|jgi:hypothetical protein|nr:hypothetical protein [Chitinophagaceae bacterium]
MRHKLLDILTRKEGPIDNEALAKYLSEKLDEEARHEVEKQLMEGSEFEDDAWEGWQYAGKGPNLLKHAEDINKKLQQQLHPAQSKRKRKAIKDFPLGWWVYGLIIILVIVAWALISYLMG